MLSKLVEAGINLENKGADWLLLVLEEAELAESRMERFSMRKFFFSLNMTESDIKAAHLAMTKSLKDALYPGTVKQFIRECLD